MKNITNSLYKFVISIPDRGASPSPSKESRNIYKIPSMVCIMVRINAVHSLITDIVIVLLLVHVSYRVRLNALYHHHHNHNHHRAFLVVQR